MEQNELRDLILSYAKKEQWHGSEIVSLLDVIDPDAQHRPGTSKRQGIWLKHHRLSGEIHLWLGTARLQKKPFTDGRHIRVLCLKTDRTGWYVHPYFEHDYKEWWERNLSYLTYLFSLQEKTNNE